MYAKGAAPMPKVKFRAFGLSPDGFGVGARPHLAGGRTANGVPTQRREAA